MIEILLQINVASKRHFLKKNPPIICFLPPEGIQIGEVLNTITNAS